MVQKADVNASLDAARAVLASQCDAEVGAVWGGAGGGGGVEPIPLKKKIQNPRKGKAQKVFCVVFLFLMILIDFFGDVCWFGWGKGFFSWRKEVGAFGDLELSP